SRHRHRRRHQAVHGIVSWWSAGRVAASADPPIARRSGLLGILAATDELLARAGRHVDPRVVLIVTPGGAGTGRVGGLAVVLPGLAHAVALLGLELGLGGRPGLRGDRHRERGGHGRGDEELRRLHVNLLPVRARLFGLAPAEPAVAASRGILGLRHGPAAERFAEPIEGQPVSHRRMNARRAPAGPWGSGIGLRSPHVAQILAERPPIGWLEVHAENYMGGGPGLRALLELRRDYPVSIHGVGLSLGTAEGLDVSHLERLAALVERVEPALVSEHVSWSSSGGTYLNHLLPLPYTEPSLALVSEHVRRVQDRLGRRLLVENPSGYLRFRESPIPEVDFLNALAARTGCGLLCDVNNVYVTCRNLGGDPGAYLDAVDAAAVGEIHLAGHALNDADGRTILIDAH